MLRKSQWSLAATALAVGAFLVTTARPAHAQVRIHLTGPVKTTLGTGIVLPPSTSSSAPASTPKPPSTPAPVVSTPAPVVTPPATTVTTTTSTSSLTGRSHSITTPASTPKPVINSAPQGFSAGPGLLGDNRIDLGYMVNRVGPDIIGVGGPSVAKVHAHH